MTADTELEIQAIRRGINRQAIASLLGKNVRSVYHYMKGARHFSLAEAVEVARLFEVPVETIHQWANMPARTVN